MAGLWLLGLLAIVPLLVLAVELPKRVAIQQTDEWQVEAASAWPVVYAESLVVWRRTAVHSNQAPLHSSVGGDGIDGRRHTTTRNFMQLRKPTLCPGT